VHDLFQKRVQFCSKSEIFSSISDILIPSETGMALFWANHANV
jgi:hypothetical protein